MENHMSKKLVISSMLGLMVLANTSTFAESGRQVYKTYCTFCHKTGLNGAPKMGDDTYWSESIKKGKETVYSNAINGVGSMPPKGGASNLSDEEIKAAVDYMVSRSGGWE